MKMPPTSRSVDARKVIRLKTTNQALFLRYYHVDLVKLCGKGFQLFRSLVDQCCSTWNMHEILPLKADPFKMQIQVYQVWCNSDFCVSTVCQRGGCFWI